jgi:hypothetical protein
MSRLMTLLCGLGAQLLAAHVAIAAPVQWTVASGGNGHYYEVVSMPGTSWDAARQEAEGMSLYGTQGHLATLTSSAENAFVTSLLTMAVTQQWFIGGAQLINSQEPMAAWAWLTGETWSYTNWNTPFQPDNHPFYADGEDALSMYSGTGPKRGFWNDAPMFSTVVPAGWEQVGGMVVEYSVPESGSLTLALVALLGGVVSRRSV